MGMTRTLNSREADRLFRAWGFVAIKTKGKTAGGHAFYAWLDEDGPRASITAPGRKHGTPEISYKKAASIVGVTLAEFLNGPDEYARTYGDAALEKLKHGPARRRGSFDPASYDDTPNPESDIPVIEEQTMSHHSPGAVQTPVTEFGERVKYALLTAETPITSSTISALAGLQHFRGETVGRAVDYLNAHGVEVVEEYRRSKGGRAFKVYFLKGGPADPHNKVKEVQEVKEVTPTLTVPEVPELRRPLTLEERALKAAAASAAAVKIKMDDRLTRILDLMERAGEPMTREEVAGALRLTFNQAAHTLVYGVKEGLLFERAARANEYRSGRSYGRTRNVYFHETPIPPRKSLLIPPPSRGVGVQPTPTPAENETVTTVTVTETEIEEIPMDTVTEPTTPPTTQTLDPSIPSIAVLRTKPDGSLVLIDAAGDLYVARKVEV